MVQAIPTGESVCARQMNIHHLTKPSPQSSFADIGYMYIIDIRYINQLYEKTKKFPFFPEKTKANIGKLKLEEKN